MKRLGQKICVAVALSLAVVAIWHDSAQAAMPVISSLGQIKDSTVGNPSRIDVDAAGTIYLCDASKNGVSRYNKYGQVLPTLKGAYKVRSNGVAVTPDGSRVFVSVAAPGETAPTTVAVIDGSTGVLLGYLGDGFNEFKRVVEIDLDGDGNIYVGNFDRAKTTNNLINTAEIDVYDGITYAKIGSFGKPATSLVNGYYRPKDGEFGEISGLTVDVVNQEVLVSEGWNNDGIARVQVFDLDGNLKQNRTEASVAGSQINCKPIGLTVEPPADPSDPLKYAKNPTGRVYMLSILTSTIHVFTTDPGVYLGKFTKGTPDPAYDPVTSAVYPWTVGMIPVPSFDTVFDPSTGRLFVVTDGNGIQIFSVDGSVNPEYLNTAPLAPVALSPIEGFEATSLTPTLQWSAAIDAEDDALTYNVKIVSLNGTTVASQENVVGTTWTVPVDKLLENNSYSWQVQAADAELTSTYSVAENFWVNALNQAPTKPLLVGPGAAATVSKDTVFSWQTATDIDPFDVVKYRLEIAKTTDFTAPVLSVTQNGVTSAAISTLPAYDVLQAGETYLWRVVAVDSDGLTTASDYRSFDCNSAPETPVLLGPVRGGEVATSTPLLQWTAFDVDGDTLTYNVQIFNAEGTVILTASDLTVTSLSVVDVTLLENNKYSWQVQAADLELASVYSPREDFWINAVPEAPTTPLLVSPVSAETAAKDSVFTWQSATDADPLATLTYRLEIAKDGDFAAPVITAEQVELNSAAFSTLSGYADLQPNGTYQWRVVAVDNTDLATASEVRSFSYASTILNVDATFPGAKVYLGGNSAYSGRYVGEVPVELRDVNPGTLEVVVELAGFEPWTKSVVVNPWQGVSVNADLVVSILPGEFKKASLIAGGEKIQGGVEAAPVFVDFDNDGLDDLLVADGSGKLLLYKGIEGAEWPVASGVEFTDLTLPSGAVPFVADWNNDDHKDLLVGAADGSVSLYLNEGTQAAPIFATAILLQANNAPLNVGSNATPLLFDLDDDGAKDLLVGSGNGTLYSYLNVGSDEAPQFGAREVLIAAVDGAANASAVVTDWDADGSKEILYTANQEIALYERQADGTYDKGDPLLVHQSLYNSKTRTYELSSSSFGEKIRMVAANTDGKSGKDLLIGNAAGEILLAYSTEHKASAISPLFDAKLMESVVEIEKLVKDKTTSSPLVNSTLNQLKKNISSQAVNKLSYYDKAKQNLLSLQNALQSDKEISELIIKLQVQLNSEIPLI